MRRCEMVPEPEDFDTQVRQPGNNWLASNPDKSPKDFWRNCRVHLAQAFEYRCAYSAMRIPSGSGTVDHYLSKRNYREQAYEWSNYRYAMGRVNGCKGNLDDRILDPFEVQDDWFRVQLPDLQLVLTDRVPPELREKAEFTLEMLQLQNSDWIIGERTYYYDAYCNGDMSFARLEKDAPLIAAAVREASEG